jgi:hypothetical protein
VTQLSAAAVAELWAHAHELADTGAREHSPPQVRRALVTMAVAGSGGDVAAFEAELLLLYAAFRRLGLDPMPLFDAASALVAEDDMDARGVFVNLPRREAPPPRRPVDLGR